MPQADYNPDAVTPLPPRRVRHGKRRSGEDTDILTLSALKEKRRAQWDIRDTLLTALALLELCFLPHAFHALLIPIISHPLKLENTPFGLTLLAMLTGTFIAIVVFIILCYLLRKQHYSLVIGIMVTVLFAEIISHPVASWLQRLNAEQVQAQSQRAKSSKPADRP